MKNFQVFHILHNSSTTLLANSLSLLFYNIAIAPKVVKISSNIYATSSTCLCVKRRKFTNVVK